MFICVSLHLSFICVSLHLCLSVFLYVFLLSVFLLICLTRCCSAHLWCHKASPRGCWLGNKDARWSFSSSPPGKEGMTSGKDSWSNLFLQRVLLQDQIFQFEESFWDAENHLCPVLRVHLLLDQIADSIKLWWIFNENTVQSAYKYNYNANTSLKQDSCNRDWEGSVDCALAKT